MMRKTLAALSVIGALAIPQPGFACRPLPFDVHLAMAGRALAAKTLDPAVRAQVRQFLAIARDGKGPRWLGERQRALNQALTILGLPEATRAPIEELSPPQREAQARAEANDMMAEIDELLAKSALSGAALEKARALRAQTADLIAARKWADALARGTDALIALGVAFPAC
jgi:hypothetical protein